MSDRVRQPEPTSVRTEREAGNNPLCPTCGLPMRWWWGGRRDARDVFICDVHGSAIIPPIPPPPPESRVREL